MASLMRICFALLLAVVAHCSPAPPARGPLVKVKNGTYMGVHSQSYNQDYFLGIPFAQAPVGPLRLNFPQPLNSSFTGVKDATKYGPICIGYGPDDENPAVTLSEDCLSLNIVRPANCSGLKLPVGVWVYGGGYIFGGSAAPQYNLSFIVENSMAIGKPFIGVSINYRVSAWGWLFSNETRAEGVTNLGLRDQRLALAWVQENIAAFGGDPSKVTIWGESAGAGSVSAQTMAFGGRDDHLFRGVIAESGAPLVASYLAPAIGQATYDNITRDTGCSTAANSLQCLRNLPFETLNNAVNVTPPYIFYEALDGDFLREESSVQLRAGQFTKTPLLIGTNTDEGTLFGPMGINTDAEFAAYIASLGPVTNSSIQTIMKLYPDIPSQGIPASLQGRPNSTIGLQYKRTSAFATDWWMLAGRRFSNQAWANQSVPSYAYRFNVLPNGYSDVQGVTHYTEVAFVYDNILGLGDFPNEFTGEPQSYYTVASLMSKAWAAFIHDLNPNGHGMQGIPQWPAYSNGNPQDFLFDASVIAKPEPDNIRAQGVAFINSIDTDQFLR